MAMPKLPRMSTVNRALEKQAGKDQALQTEEQGVAARYEAERQPARSALEKMLTMQAPTLDQNTEFRKAQTDLLQQLTQRAMGQGPSIAQQQFQQAGNTALQKSMGAIRAATGANAALAGRTAALGGTNMLGNLAAESGMARLKEQQDAQTMLGRLAGEGRQQDTTLGATNIDALVKTIAAQQMAAKGLLDSAATRYEGHYNRGAQVKTAKAGQGGGDTNWEGVLATIAGSAIPAILADKKKTP
jgi:hypothetical protein